MSGFSALGFDPTPGSVGALHGFVRQLDSGVRSTDEALTLMNGGDGTWEGEAAMAFRATLDNDFRPQLRDVNSAFRTSRDALSGWADELGAFQTRAEQLEAEAQLAVGTVGRRTRELMQAQDEARADPVAAAGTDDLSDASRRARQAQGQLDEIRRRARALENEANGRAIACAGLLDDAVAAIAAYEGSRWDQFTSWVGDMGAAIADGYEWFMDNVMPILEDIIDTIGPIVAVLALFIPALGPLALGLAIASVAIDGLQALRGEEGAAEEFFMGLAGLALGGALGKVGKALGDGTRQVLVPTLSGGSGMLATAGGGVTAGAGAMTMALRYSPQAAMANTMWLSTKATEAQLASNDLVGALTQPVVNLGERGRNLIQGNGPRTDQELMDRD